VSGAEGLLVGAGHGVCRLELIAATEPVEPGDMVVTAATIPGIDEELYLGEVESAGLTAGASHWAITVRPAVEISRHEQLQVVRVGLHPGRRAADAADREQPLQTVQGAEENRR
jgi:cell shape-determining protein MreC